MDVQLIQRLWERRETTTSELRKLGEEADGRDMTGDEQQTEQRLLATIADCDRRITAGLGQIRAEQAAADARGRFDELTGRPTPAGGDDDRPSAPTLGDQLRKLARGELRRVDIDLEPRSTPPYGGMVTTGETDIIRPEFVETLWEVLRYTSTVIQANATILRTSGGEPIRLPVTDGHSAAVIVGEAQPLTPSDPTFDSVELNAYKYGWLTQVSRELLDDDIFDLPGYLARDGGVSMGNGIGTDLVVGSGTDKPKGALIAAATGKTLAATTAITSDEIIDAYHSVSVPYRRNATWVMNDAVAAVVRKFKNTVTGDYMWQPGLQAGQPDILLGRPVITDPAMPASITAGGNVILFGDLAGYVVRFAGPLRIERSDEFAFDSDQVTFRFLQRADGDLRDTTSVRKVVAHA